MENSINNTTIASFVVKSIMQHYGFTTSQLTDKIGAKYSQVYNMIDGRSETVGKKYAALISNAFPELRYDWIITGRGEMFNAESQKQPAEPKPAAEPRSVYHNPDLASVMLNMITKIDELSAMIKQQNLQISSLSNLVIEQRMRIDSLVDDLASRDLKSQSEDSIKSSQYATIVADKSALNKTKTI